MAHLIAKAERTKQMEPILTILVLSDLTEAFLQFNPLDYWWQFGIRANEIMGVCLFAKNCKCCAILLLKGDWPTQCTLPTAEILSGKNAPAFVVCGFLMKSFKKKIS